MAQKSNTTSQGASASVNERSRKNRFGFQFWLQSFFHGEQNVQFAQNLKNLKKIQGILIRNNAFVAWAWCRWLLQVRLNTYTWLVQTSNIILIVQRGAIWARHGIEDLVRSVDILGGFSKIARDPTVRF